MKFLYYADKVSIRAKLTFFALVALVAVAIPTYFLNEQATSDVELASLSIDGVPLVQQTVILRKLIAQHRGTSARWLGGDETAQATLIEVGSEVDAVFRGLLTELESNPQGEAAKLLLQQDYATWNTLKINAVNKVSSGSVIFSQHSQLILDLAKVAASILRNFKLIYAPSDSAYHLVIANFNALPVLTNTLGKIRGLGAGILASQAISPDQRATLVGLIDNAKAANLEFSQNLRYTAETSSKPSLQGLTRDIDEFNRALSQTIAILERNILFVETLEYPSADFFNGVTREIDSLYLKQSQYVAELSILLEEYNQVTRQQRSSKWWSLSLLTGLAALVFIAVNRSITRGIGSIVSALNKLTANKFEIAFPHKRQDEIGVIQKNVESLAKALEAFSKESIEAIRVKKALDNSSSSFMMADTNRNIIYMNDAIKALFGEAEADIRKSLPNFSAKELMGQSIDSFHQNPSHQAKLLDTFNSQYDVQIEVGGRYFKLIATPIMSDKGERLGSAVEWIDRTRDVMAEGEIASLVSAAVHGDYSFRAETNGKDGFHLNLSTGLNELLDVTEKGLQEISQILVAIANGDLTKRITSDFEGTLGDMKNAANNSADNLAEVIYGIRETSETINNGSGEIARGNADLSARTEQQAANLEETASSMEQMTSTVQLNADNAKQASSLASEASKIASEGGQLLESTVSTMSEINDSATKIADIISVIDGIAFQTNILALNAAVEAARAGEQGRGFAVVASEVRTLAQRSANAAKDIKELISDSVRKVESGNQLVNKSGETMHKIVSSVDNVNNIMSEIAAASVQQASGIDAINKAIAQMDEMTQQNAALVEEAAAAAESMSSQAEQLESRVRTFSIDASVLAKTSLQQPMIEQRALGDSNSKKIIERDLPRTVTDDDDEWESF